MTWIDAPWQDETDARWSNVWRLFVRALGCTLRGHQMRTFGPDAEIEDDERWQYCRRCHRKWEWDQEANDAR